jgi:phosphate transport system protein
MRDEFERDLAKLTQETLRMISTLREMVENATRALVEQDLVLAQEVIRKDKEVDLLELEIERAITTLIARQAPVASDMRFLVSLLKMLTDFERAGDYAVHIAKDAIVLAGEPLLRSHSSFADLGRRLQSMLDLCAKALAEHDLPAAREVIRQDDEIDGAYESITRELLTYMLEDPRTISKALTLMHVTRFYERLGDHLENVAERIMYWLTGKMVKHPDEGSS